MKIRGITMENDLIEEILSLVNAEGTGAKKSQKIMKFSSEFLFFLAK